MARKYYIQLSSGEKWEISELDFNNIEARVSTGRTNGWYMQRGFIDNSDRHDWKVNFKDIASVFAGSMKDTTIPSPEKIDIEKRKPKPVGKPKEKPKGCEHDWNNPDHWVHVTKIVGGVNRYYKQCNECGGFSGLIKKREVELACEQNDMDFNDVPLVE